jgi:hypothetical protein
MADNGPSGHIGKRRMGPYLPGPDVSVQFQAPTRLIRRGELKWAFQNEWYFCIAAVG